jgi:gas vesicle protein
MEQFLYGLLAGTALGMWLAILLYTVTGKRQQGWPLRRKKKQDEQSAAQALSDDGPEDDFDDAYYAQRFPDDGPATTSASDPEPPVEPASAPDPSTDVAKSTASVDEAANEIVNGNANVFVVYTDTGSDAGQNVGQNKVSDASDNQESGEDEVYRRLVAKMDGDVEATDRLIAYERERAPAAPRANLIQNALDRLEYGPQ